MPTPVIAYGVICIFWAIANGRYINADGPILHWANMIIHATTCGYFALSVSWILGLAMFFEARPFFDTTLYLTRFGWKKIWYVPDNPSSVIDRLEKAIFGNNGWLPKLIYTAAFVGLLFLLKDH
jgi:hypothetical protein